MSAANAIGSNIRAMRKRAGVTQSDLASAIGHVRTTVVAMEDGKRKRYAVAELEAIAAALGCSVDALRHGEPPAADTEAELYEGGL